MPPTQYPELIYIYPANTDSPVQSLQPQIKLAWSNDVPTAQFSDAELLPSAVSMTNETTGVQVELEYVSYDSTERLITLQPVSSLDTSTSYRLIIHRGIRDTYGRSHPSDRTFTFYTAASAVPDTSPLLPNDYSVQASVPTFTWEDVGTYYVFQVDNNPGFQSPLETELVFSASYLPTAAFSVDTTYYWRVRAVSGSASGDWSDTKSFYLGSSSTAHPSTSLVPTPAFGLDYYSFEDLNTNLSSWPDIQITFTQTLSDAASGYLEIRKRDVLVRNDVAASYDATSVSGTWTIDDKTATFIVLEAITENTRYEVLLKKNLPSSGGEVLSEPHLLYFTSSYTPYYTDFLSVIAMLGREGSMVPDDLINWTIHVQSIEANVRYYQELHPINQTGPEGISNTNARNPQLKSYAVQRWVTASVAVQLLKRALNDELRNVGRTVRLADYHESLDADFIKAIQEALKNAQEELDKWTSELVGAYDMYATSRSSRWSWHNWHGDYMVHHPESWRPEF